MVMEMRARQAEVAYQVSASGRPTYTASNPTTARLLDQAAFVTLVEGWAAADGEEMLLLVLRDDGGLMVGALPAPADDEAWLAAFEASPVMIAVRPQARSKELVIQAG